MRFGYARVSSREQAENSHALDQQCSRLQGAGCSEILRDVESGSSDKRLNFLRLMELARAGVVSEVVVTRLDRLTRSLPTLRKTVDELQRFGIALVALDDAIDTGTAAGKFQLNILGALAEMETDRLSERVRHGWAHLRDRKVAMNPPFGYIKGGDPCGNGKAARHLLDHNPFLCLLSTRDELSRYQIARDVVEAFLTRKTLRLALREINERYGIQTFAHTGGGRVAREMFRFSPAGLCNWLTNPVLQGHLSYLRGRAYKGRAEIIYNTHEPLISPDEAREIEAIISRNRQTRGYGSTALKYPLSGLIFCGECRGACYSMKSGRGRNLPGHNYYFQCKNWRTRGCSQKAVVRMELCEAAVIDALLQRVEAIANLAATTEQAETPELQDLRSELAYYQSAPGNRAAAIVSELQSQIDSLRIQGQQGSQVSESNRALLLQCFGDRATWELLISPEEKQQIYRALVDRVTVKDGRVVAVSLRV